MTDRRGPAVLVIGIDAADPALIRRWAAEGALPTFDLLIRGALRSRLISPPGFYSSAVWPELNTGVSVARHGHHSHQRYEPETYHARGHRGSEIPYPPFWERLSGAGLRTAILDVPMAPMSPRLNGIQVRDWGTHDPMGRFQTAPEELSGEITGRFGRDPVGQCDRGGRGQTDIRRFRDRLLDRVRRRTGMSEHVLKLDRWDLVMTCFTEPHCIGHNAWHQHDSGHPRHDPVLARQLGDPVRDVYKAVDSGIARLLKRTPETTRVFVFSSHGMGPNYNSTYVLDRILRALTNEPQYRGSVYEALYRSWQVMPVPVRNVMQGVKRGIRNALMGPERRQRRFFQIHNTSACGGIRFNVRGRDPEGTIEPGRELDAICSELKGDLLDLENGETGEPIVARIWRTDEVYGADHAPNLPDMVVEWTGKQPVSVIRSGRIGELRRVGFRGHRTGDHLPDGVLFALGPGIRRGRLPRPVKAADFPASLCTLFGVPRSDMDGRERRALIGEGPVAG